MAATAAARLLVLGGTDFVGRVVVEEALARGWDVTVLNRGTRATPAGGSALLGDRTAPDGLAALSDGTWDLVVDTWSWAPSAVGAAAEALVDRVDRYAYVSSRSVYAFPPPAGGNEHAPLVDPDVLPETDYAARKRRSEQALEAVLGDRALLARAGLILGRHENIGRLPWWLTRIARGGDVLAPGPPDLALQLIDVRDLAAWLLAAAAGGVGGPVDVVSPPGHATTAELLEACVAVTGADARLRWADPTILAEAGVEPWTELPIWLPPGPVHDGLHGSDVSRALATGLRCRPVTETVADTWAWLQAVGTPPQRPDRPPVGLAPEVETRILRILDG